MQRMVIYGETEGLVHPGEPQSCTTILRKGILKEFKVLISAKSGAGVKIIVSLPAGMIKRKNVMFIVFHLWKGIEMKFCTGAIPFHYMSHIIHNMVPLNMFTQLITVHITQLIKYLAPHIRVNMSHVVIYTLYKI